MNNLSRRTFLSLAALSPLMSYAKAMKPATNEAKPLTILFQGDSITDGNRGRSADPNHIMGHGYAFYIAAKLGSEHPERNLKFINKGTSGDTVNALQQRWKEDALIQAPDVLSILVGVNDILFRIRNGNTSTPSAYEEEYRKLLQTTRNELPQTKLILSEPFILPVGMVSENTTVWKQEVSHAQVVVKKLATEFNALFIPYQSTFDKALKHAPADYWIWDGIHPTVAGHGLMAKEWLMQVSKQVREVKS